MLLRALCAMLVCQAGCASDDADADDPSLHVCTSSQPVYFGTDAPSHLLLSPGQISAIGQVADGACSGVLFREGWVATARHCTANEPANALNFVTVDESGLSHSYEVAAKFEHETYDFSILQLSGRATRPDATIVPIALNVEAIEHRVGDLFEAAGFGTTDTGERGELRFTAERVIEVSDAAITIDGAGRRGLCSGDSGGPLLAMFRGVVRVAGVLSRGEESCVGKDQFVRTDTLQDWITEQTGQPTDAASDDAPCQPERE